jgi:hypothetical protein
MIENNERENSGIFNIDLYKEQKIDLSFKHKFTNINLSIKRIKEQRNKTIY